MSAKQERPRTIPGKEYQQEAISDGDVDANLNDGSGTRKVRRRFEVLATSVCKVQCDSTASRSLNGAASLLHRDKLRR